MINASEFREEINIENKPGYYKWWAKKEEFDFLLNKLNVNYDDIEDSLDIKDDLFCIYVGIAVNESVAKRLDWHINEKHSFSKVKHKYLSTLRQSLSSVISNNQADEMSTNEFIDKLKVEYFLFDYPIKSDEAKSEIKAIENELLEKNLYILNIQDNKHPLAKPIKKTLKKLRKESNANALDYYESHEDIKSNLKEETNMIDAIKLRNKEELNKIDAKPGYIKFWAYRDEIIFILNKLNAEFDDIEHLLETKNDLYCIYIGKTTDRPVSKRLDQHINGKHYESNITQGFLSTFRQSVSSIVSLNQADEEGTNDFIDKLKVEYYLLDYPFKSNDLKRELNSIVDESLEKYFYVLNIVGNKHEDGKPIIKELKKLRKESKENALIYYEENEK